MPPAPAPPPAATSIFDFDDDKPLTARPVPSTEPASPAAAPPLPAPPPAGRPAAREVSIAPGVVAQRFAEKGGAALENRIVRDVTVSLKRRQPEGKTGAVGMSFRWTGLIHVPQAGRYAFHVEADGDAIAWVGRRAVVRRHRTPADGDGEPPAELNAGYYPLSVSVSNLFGGEEIRVQLQWKPPGVGELAVVPATSLFHIVKSDAAPAPAVAPPNLAAGPTTTTKVGPSAASDNAPAVAAPAPAVPTTPPARLAGLYDLNAAPPNAPAPPAPAADPQAVPEGKAPGVVVEVYEGIQFDTLVQVRSQRQAVVRLNRPPADAGPAGEAKPVGVLVTPLSFRWSGWLQVPADGEYALAVTGGGSGRVEIDGQPVYEHTRGQPFKTSRVALKAGPHQLSAAASNIGIAGPFSWAMLSWMPPGVEALQPVPGELLVHDYSERFDKPAGAGRPPKRKPGNGLGPTAAAVPDKAGGPTTVPGGTGSKPAPARPASAARPQVRRGATPVPDEGQLAEARKRVREKFAAYYAERKPTVQQALVQKLTEAAGLDATPPVERYALLKEAADVAAANGDWRAALGAVRQISSLFAVDEVEPSLAVLTSAARTLAGRTPPAAREIAAAVLEVAEVAAVSDNYAAAVRAAAQAEQVARGADDVLAARAKARASQLREAQSEFGRLGPTFARLRSDPADRDANTRAGKFACLIAGDWDRGLAMLARGGDVELKVLAELEQAQPADDPARMKVGDAWWDRAKAERGPYAGACQARAAAWYQLVGDQPDATTTTRLRQRVATAAGADLLRGVEIPRDVVQGTWRWNARDLLASGRGWYLLQLPCRPAEEYDFWVEFTPSRDFGFYLITFPVGDGFVTWEASNTSANLVYGARNSPPIRRELDSLQPGVRHALMVRVRRDKTLAYVDDRLLLDWPVDPGFRGSVDLWRLRDPKSVGVGSTVEMVVHAACAVDVPSAAAQKQ